MSLPLGPWAFPAFSATGKTDCYGDISQRFSPGDSSISGRVPLLDGLYAGELSQSLKAVYPIVYNYSYLLVEGILTVIVIRVPAVASALER